MTQAINTIVTTALAAAHAYGDAIAKLRKVLMGQTSPEIADTLRPYIAAYYKVQLVAKERGEGMTLDKDAPKYEAARKALQRMTKDILGPSVARTAEPAALSREQLRLIRLCHEAGITMKMFGQGVAKIKS